MSENGCSADHCIQKASSNVLFYPQPKDIQFTVIEEERNQNIYHFTFLNYYFFLTVLTFYKNIDNTKKCFAGTVKKEY